MILRNIIFSLRNIRKNGTYSIINITGLSLGIAVVVLILLWVVDELNFDKYHKNLCRIYTVYGHHQYSEGQDRYTSSTPFPLNQEITKNYPEIENATTYLNTWNQLIKFEDKEYKEGPVIYADRNFLNIFSFNVLEGDKNALLSSDKVIITQELAQLFFGKKPAVGKMLTFNGEKSLTIGAVIATQHANSTLKFKVLAPIELMKSQGIDLSQWTNNWPNTTILLRKGVDPKSLDPKITNICKNKGQPNATLHLFPYKDEHLYTYSGKGNRIQYIYQFLAIALIIILIASINFINLSITKAERRRSEVGVRKVMGAGRSNILRQFLLEKGLMIFFSLVVSGMLVFLLLPVFRSISGKILTPDSMQNVYLIGMLLVVILIVMGLSVVYPSIYLSSINTILAPKKAGNSKRGSVNLKSLLVIVQFVLAIILISGSITISKQINYVNNYDLGYNHANLIFLELNGDAKNKHDALKQELSKVSGIESMTMSDKLPFERGSSSWGHDWEGKDKDSKVLICKTNVDKNYFKTMGIKLVDGNYFPDKYDKVLKQEEFSSPQVILNKEAIKRMGIKNPVGKYFSLWSNKKGTIVGVVDDFHFESLHNSVEPLLLLPLVDNPGVIIARVSPKNFSQTINNIKKSWLKVVPQTACEIGFFDDRLANLYNAEMKISGLVNYFSLVAIFISCIGLFGLSLFIIEQRKKEVGVRKVNGAKTSEVMILLNKDFLKWVAISFVIACPIAYYAMHQWLQNFAYKTELSWWIFAAAGAVAVVVAVITVSWQSLRAATRNPVEALRYE